MGEAKAARAAMLLSPVELCCGADLDEWTRNLEVRLAEPEEFLEIISSPTMMLDHFPDRIHAALQKVASRGTPQHLPPSPGTPQMGRLSAGQPSEMPLSSSPKEQKDLTAHLMEDEARLHQACERQRDEEEGWQQ